MKKIFKHLLAAGTLLLSFLSAENSYAHWNSKGPYGGSVSCMVAADTNLFIGTYTGGVLRSLNATLASYRTFGTGMTSGAVRALAYNGTVIVAGTADAGIFTSSDIGVNWTQNNSGLGNNHVLSLAASGSTLFAGTNGGGIFKSTNNGADWTASGNGLTNQTVTALAADGSTLYAGTAGGGVFRSTDGGSTWAAFNSGLSNQDVQALSIAGPNVLAATAGGTFAVATSGSSWSSASTGLGSAQVRSFATGAGTVYAATTAGVFSSPASSVSWSAANSGMAADTVNALAVFNTGTPRLVAGTQQSGLFKTTVSAMSWTANNNGFNNLDAYTLYCNGNMIIGATHQGVFVSRDLAASYVRANQGLTDSTHVRSFAFVGPVLYAGTGRGGVFVTTDTGRTWTTANSGLSNLQVRQLLATGTHLYAATADGNVFRTAHAPISWTQVSSGLPAGLQITALASDGAAVFLGTAGSGVFASTSGTSWMAVNNGLSNQNVTALAVLGSNLYAATMGAGVFRSEVSNLSWTGASSGLPSNDILALGVTGNYVLAGYRGGVYATYDQGMSWLPPQVMVNIPTFADITGISFTTNRIFISTSHNSLYSNALTELPVTGIAEIYANGKGLAVYPNPGSGRFVLSFDELPAGNIEVMIYNHSGAAVKRAVNTLKFTEALPAGLYVVQINTRLGTAYRKLVVE